MLIERRALYNSLRIHWLHNPSLTIESWQVEDLRSIPLENLFQKLATQGIRLDRNSFIAYGQNAESPEDLTAILIGDLTLDSTIQDKIYLVIFELWRRLLPEKRSLSIFCDELDYQISLYDSQAETQETIQDVLAYLEQLLVENSDQGQKPQAIFKLVGSFCANDVESFIYDFIIDQIEQENYSYASELLESFFPYIQNSLWFEFLQARLSMRSDPVAANELLRKILRKSQNLLDIDFNLEVLSYLVQDGEKDLFTQLAKQTLSLVKTKEDLAEILYLAADYYHCLDDDKQEKEIAEILTKRAHLTDPISQEDPILKNVKNLLKNKSPA